MRVLVVHNRYSSRVPSGENLAVDDEVRWLCDGGVDVVRHEVSNDEIVSPGPLGRVREAVDAVWSVPARRRFQAALDDVAPEVVHVHNLFPLLSGSVPTAARRRGVPVVWTVHNRRLRCVGGGHFRDGAPCHDCRPGWRVPGVAHRCYAGSTGASALVSASSSLFRVTARRDGVVPIAISRHMADWLGSSAGFDPARVRVKYNAVAAARVPRTDPAARRRFVFAARLALYKGVGLLLDAWQQVPPDLDVTLRIVGDGDAADRVRAAATTDPRIEWVGHVAPGDVGKHLDASRTVLVPSLWEEPFGRVAAEAFAHGRPVITTGRGGLAEIVDDATGWVTGTSPAALADAIVEAARSDDAVRRRGDAGLRRHADRFSPQATTEVLRDIYHEACGDRASSGSGRA
jgi:glycosyltransferase involved in cell wall biosynthesis